MAEPGMAETGETGGDLADAEQGLRERAVKQIKRKREFVRNLVIYVVVNAGLWAFWAYDGADTDDLWPAIVSGIWGVFLLLDLFKIYGERPISDDQIRREMDRISGR